MNKLQRAEQFRAALQLFAQSLSDEAAMEVATVFPEWHTGQSYAVDTFLTYGENAVGDPQLYKVIQAHVSQDDWTPDAAVSLYTPIGVTPDGYPIWSQPTGAHDAYSIGDIVEFDGILYISTIDANVYRPDVYGWEVYEG